MVLVFEGVVETRRYALSGTFVAYPAVVVDPARQLFELFVATEHAFEVCLRHGEFVGGLVGGFVGGGGGGVDGGFG